MNPDQPTTDEQDSSADPSTARPSGRWLPTRYHALLVAAIVAAPLLAYAPALNRVFTIHDSLWYLAELDGSTSLADGLALCDYNRVARFQRADGILFRPVFFAWLAVQNWMGGSDYASWNIGNLTAHVVVCLCLYALLMRIQPSPIAGWAALVFSVHLANFDLVSWNQTGLLPAFALLVLAIGAAHSLLEPDAKWNRWEVAAYLTAMTLAAFAFELAVPVSAVVSGLVLVRFRREGVRRALARGTIAAIPFLIYAGVYGIRWWLAGDAVTKSSSFPGSFFEALADTARLLGIYLERFVAFGGLDYVHVAYGRAGMGHTWNWSRAWSGVSQLISLGILLSAFRGTTLPAVRARRYLLCLVSLTAVGYVFMLRLGRGYHEAATHTHYTYLFCLLATVFAYALIDWNRLNPRNRRNVTSLLLVAVMLNGWLTFTEAYEVRRANADADAFLSSVAEFVEDHTDEPGFSFRMAGPPSRLDPPVVLIEGRQDDPNAPRIHTRASKILFAKSYREANPRYVLHWTGRTLDVQSTSRRE